MGVIGEINPNVSTQAQIPGTYLYISTAPTTIGVAEPKDLFLVATGILSGSQITNAPYSLTAGTATPNSIVQYSNTTRVNQALGRKSPIANRFRSALQEVPIGINIFLAALGEPTGSGFSGMATKIPTFIGTAAGSGQIKLRVCGEDVPVSVSDGDTGSDIAAAAKLAVSRYLLDAPMVAADVIDHSLPQITIATNATGSNYTFTANGIAKVVAITAGWTPTQSATAIAAALSGDASYPLTATSALGVVLPTWRTGVMPATLVSAGADATQTYTLAYLTTGSSSGATLPLTYVTRGLDGNDSPLLIDIPPEITGISIAFASLTVATNAAGASGSASLFTLHDDAIDYIVSIPVATTPAQAAALIIAEINATTGPLSAMAVGPSVTLLARSGWYSRKLTVASTEDGGGQTYRLYDRHDSAGAITSVVTTAGTATATSLQGSGAPTLTTLLNNATKKQNGYTEWSADYLDATSTSALYATVEPQADGFNQKGQRVTFVSTDPLETARDVATSASPQLGNSWRYSVGVAQGGGVQGGAYSAQTSARLCATDLPFNFDGQALTIGVDAPMLPGRTDTDLTDTSKDVAMGQYHLFVIEGRNGVPTIVRGKTTWTASNTEWGDWSYGRTFDKVRFGMRAFLQTRFKQTVLFTVSDTIRVPNGRKPRDIKNAIGEYLDSIDGVICDGAKDLKKFIAVEPVQGVSGFVRIFFRERPPRELHIISGVIAAAA